MCLAIRNHCSGKNAVFLMEAQIEEALLAYYIFAAARFDMESLYVPFIDFWKMIKTSAF